MSQIKKPPIVLSGFSSRRKFFSEFADSLLNSGGGTTGARTHTIPFLLLGEVSPNNPSPLEWGLGYLGQKKTVLVFFAILFTIQLLLYYCHIVGVQGLSICRDPD
jgi:hypothetical protein